MWILVLALIILVVIMMWRLGQHEQRLKLLENKEKQYFVWLDKIFTRLKIKKSYEPPSKRHV